MLSVYLYLFMLDMLCFDVFLSILHSYSFSHHILQTRVVLGWGGGKGRFVAEKKSEKREVT